MALGAKYATRDELKARVGIPLADTDHDTRLDNVLDTASRDIEKATGRQFNDAGSATAREYEPCDTVWLDVDDFSTVTGLVVKVDSAGDGTFATTLASTFYKPYPLNGVVDGETGWPFYQLKAVNYAWPGSYYLPPVQVTARWGWTAVPSGVHEACLILAEELFKLADTPFGTGGYSQFGIIRARVNPHCWQRIAPYVRHRVLVG